jgi:Nitrogen regulatory protein P-II
MPTPSSGLSAWWPRRRHGGSMAHIATEHARLPRRPAHPPKDDRKRQPTAASVLQPSPACAVPRHSITQIGDGKIFVLDIENAVRIRTGETDVAAICGKAARTDLGGGREVTRVPTAKGVFCCTCSRQLLAQSCPERVRRNVRSWRKLTLRVNDERRSAAKFRMNRTKTAPCLKTSSRPDTLSVRCYVRSSSWRRVHTGRVT